MVRTTKDVALVADFAAVDTNHDCATARSVSTFHFHCTFSFTCVPMDKYSKPKKFKNSNKQKKKNRKAQPKASKHDQQPRNQSQSNQTHKGTQNRSQNTQQKRPEHKTGARDFFKASSLLFASTVASKCTSLLGDDRDTSSSGQAGVFDFYLFAQSWAPRFCCTSLEKCLAENMNGYADLSTHGLWPAYSDADKDGRTYPAFCSPLRTAPIPGAPPHLAHSRADHEWDKHGTCTGLPRSSYHQEEVEVAARESIQEAGHLLRDHAGKTIELEELSESYGGFELAAFKSDKFCRLEEITTCWEKLPGGRVGRQIPCPRHVLESARNSAIAEHKCRALVLDSAGECKFVPKKLLRDLKFSE
jgi:ribonuclease T2